MAFYSSPGQDACVPLFLRRASACPPPVSGKLKQVSSEKRAALVVFFCRLIGRGYIGYVAYIGHICISWFGEKLHV